MATRSNNLSFANRSVRWVTASALAFVAAGVVAVPTSFAAGTTTAPAPVVVPATGGSAAGVPLTDGSMYNVVDKINARSMWTKGYTGKGVNVALIDTGVAPVAALSGADKVVATVDLSTEANTPGAQFLDTFGHGTHMAGIIAGRDPGADPKLAATHPEWFMGVAPDAGLVSVKVGDNTGAVDVTQVIAGIDWVVENASALNIRVINLSYGTDSTLPYTVDPLDAAVERAWKAGIVVVAAVGNDGRNAQHLLAPANDPYVVAVAAAERKNDALVNSSSAVKKWKVPTWANSGNGQRDPDVSAPGASIVSLRDPGSRVDTEHPEGYVSTSLFKGSGSSQATAVVSGLVALLLSAKPSMTPDQIKKTLSESALHDVISPQDARFSGFGLVRADLTKLADLAQSDKRWQNWPASNGSGNLDAVRNGSYVTVNDQVISGNITVTGAPWSTTPWVGPTWSEGTWNGSMFVDGSWRGVKWTGVKWTGVKWTGVKWTGVKWTDALWTGVKWTDESWTGMLWDGVKWTGASWDGVKWTGDDWTGVKWTGVKWTGASWSGAAWQ